ncbi:MAG: phage tail tape measure protein [Shewanella sp.]
MKLIFELVVQDVNVTSELQKQKQLVKELSKELDGIDAGAAGFEDLADRLAFAKTQVQKLTEEQKALNREFKATQVPTDSLAGLRLEYSRLMDQISKLTAAERASDFGRGLVKNAADIKGQINGIQESVGNFTGSVGNYKKALLSIGNIASAGLIFGGIERGIQLVTDAVIAGIKEFANYEKALDNLQALTGISTQGLERFKNKAQELTTIKIGDFEIKNSATEIVEAFKLVGGAQPELLKSADALASVTKEAIVLSKASGLDLKPSVEAVTTVLGQFGEPADQANRIINELAAGAKVGASEIPATTEALQKFGTTADVVNVSTAESIALVQTLAEKQLKGGEAGTQLRNVLAKLASADILPRNAIRELTEAGVNINILRDTTLPLQDRLAELSKIAGNTSAIVKTFGLENLAAGQILTQASKRLDDGTTAYGNFLKGIEGTNEAYKQAEINSGNLATAFENLKKDGINAAIEGFETLSPLLAFFLNVIGGVIKAVIIFFSVLRELPTFFKENKAAIEGLILGLTLLNAEQIFASANALRLAASQRIAAIATAATTTAQWLLNAALTANPIGIVITALAGIALAFQAAYQRSETFRAAISGLGAIVSEFFTIIQESFAAFTRGFSQIRDGDFSGAFSSFLEAGEKSIGAAFTQGGRLRDAFNKGYNSKIQEARDEESARQDEEDLRAQGRAKQDAANTRDPSLPESPDAAFDRDAKAKANAQKKALDEREKELEAQVSRISELQKSIRDLDASTITDDFDRQSVEVENKRADALNKVAAAREALVKKIAEQKGVLTEADKQEQALISEQAASITAIYDKQLKDIAKARQRAADAQLAELAALSLEVLDLAAKNDEALARAESDLVTNAFERQREVLEATLETRKQILRDQLSEGVISQKQFKDQFVQAQQDFNSDVLKLELERADQIKDIDARLESSRIAAAKAARDVRLQAIEEETKAAIQAAKDQAAAQGGGQGNSNEAELEALRLKGIERRKQAEQEYADAVRNAQDDTINRELEGQRAIRDANKQTHEDNIEQIEEERARRLEIQEALIDTASTVSGAVFEIQRNRINEEKDEAISALDTEFAARREAAAGNADQLALLDAEYQKKKEKIEKDAAKKRKQIAITEAVIQGALAVVKALPNLVLAAVTAVATAAQVAVISSQKFARGGAVKFAKQGVFGGKPHSQGGTKGVFDDGTQVEVEDGERFFILNRKASRKIHQLSEFNYAHGGRKFADGGVLSFTPQFNQTLDGRSGGSVMVVSAQFTDEQISTVANRLAESTSAATGQAVSKGLDTRNRTAEREQIMEANRQV